MRLNIVKKLKLLTNTYDLNDLIDEFRDNPNSPLFKMLKFTKNDYIDLYYETVALGYTNPFPKSVHEKPFMTEIPYPLVRVDKQYCNLMGIDAPDLDYDQMLYDPTSHKFVQYSNRFGPIVTTEIKGSKFENGKIVKNARYKSYIGYYKNLIKQIKSLGNVTKSMITDVKSIDPYTAKMLYTDVSAKENINCLKNRIEFYKKLVQGKVVRQESLEKPYRDERDIADSL